VHRPLAGYVALVTGGVHGLGRAVAWLLARDGMDVVVNYRRSEADAQAFCGELRALGVRAVALGADVSRPQEAEELVRQVEELWGRVDALVLAAGPFREERRSVAWADRGAQAWQEMAMGNVTGTVAAVAAALPGMRQRRFGRIVTFGMDRVIDAPAWPGRGAYAAAKVALWSYTRTLALEEARYGITANMVAPGRIVGPWKEATIAQARAAQDAPRSPVGRPGTGEDVARVVRFLVDPDSDFVTGSVLAVTGGEGVVPVHAGALTAEDILPAQEAEGVRGTP
jgi:3-oxoacyl-[acyl-carrier protein] reductase